MRLGLQRLLFTYPAGGPSSAGIVGYAPHASTAAARIQQQFSGFCATSNSRWLPLHQRAATAQGDWDVSPSYWMLRHGWTEVVLRYWWRRLRSAAEGHPRPTASVAPTGFILPGHNALIRRAATTADQGGLLLRADSALQDDGTNQRCRRFSTAHDISSVCRPLRALEGLGRSALRRSRARAIPRRSGPRPPASPPKLSPDWHQQDRRFQPCPLLRRL